jgi:hypothetical protein
MEEDLIFPCGQHPRASQSSVPRSLATKKSEGSLNASNTSASEGSFRKRSLPAKISDCLLIENFGIQDLDYMALSKGSRRSTDYTINPRDHRRMLASWRKMLHVRFLAPQLISILPFYLSSIFDTVQPQRLMQVRLPPNSNVVYRDNNSSFEHDSGLSFNVQPPSTPTAKECDKHGPSSPLPSSTSPLQLARRVYTIMACKEPIWVEYEALYGTSPTVSKVHGRDTNTARDEFEFYWSNWVKYVERFCHPLVVSMHNLFLQ